jgi:P-type E1-E2 ATPase
MTVEIAIPRRETISLHHVLLDVNGTLAVDGMLIEGVAERLLALRQHLEIHMITANTHGRQSTIDAELGLSARLMQPGDERLQKAMYLDELGRTNTAAIGNGNNDVWMIQSAAIGIAVLGQEGLSIEALQAADLVVPSILDALDLLLNPRRLVATLRA